MAKIGSDAVASWCADLLTGRAVNDDPNLPALEWIGGRHASHIGQDYWTRVWAARGLLYAWSSEAESAILAGLHDPAWRVREMCAKVARKRRLESAGPILTHLGDDAVARVRVAAEAALMELERSTGSRTPRASPPRRPPR